MGFKLLASLRSLTILSIVWEAGLWSNIPLGKEELGDNPHEFTVVIHIVTHRTVKGLLGVRLWAKLWGPSGERADMASAFMKLTAPWGRDKKLPSMQPRNMTQKAIAE